MCDEWSSGRWADIEGLMLAAGVVDVDECVAEGLTRSWFEVKVGLPAWFVFTVRRSTLDIRQTPFPDQTNMKSCLIWTVVSRFGYLLWAKPFL